MYYVKIPVLIPVRNFISNPDTSLLKQLISTTARELGLYIPKSET